MTSAAPTQALQFHPLADLFPLIEGAEFDELVADVRAHGVREPIWLYQDKTLDGRNRWLASQAAGVPCPTRVYDGDDPVGFVISLNLKRRHLSESQRAMVAAKLATLKLGDNQHSEGSSIEGASRLLNVGHASVERAKTVQRTGAPELAQAVERGSVSVSAAADIASRPIDEQREIVARGEKEILRVAQEIRARKGEQRRAERIERMIEISKGNADLPTGRSWPIIVADPAWKYERPAYGLHARFADEIYPEMELDEICALPVGDIAAPDALLFLWGARADLGAGISGNSCVGVRIPDRHGLG
jgi:hypothetical protein